MSTGSTRHRKTPTERDLAIWRGVNDDLVDWLYSGLTGRFQQAGHRVIDAWSEPFKSEPILEIGSGHGHHLVYGRGGHEFYVGMDIEEKFLRTMRTRYPTATPVRGDAYALPFRSGTVGCVLAVYNFEHLRQLGTALSEIRRVLRPGGELLIGLPAEGGLAYGIGRALTSKRYMERKYGVDYDAIVQWEHWNRYREVEAALKVDFEIAERRFIPMRVIPSVDLNVIICLRTRPREVRT